MKRHCSSRFRRSLGLALLPWLGILAGAAAAPEGKVEASEPIAANLFSVPEGLEINLWARSPLLFNPANIDVDRQGRIWVAEAVNYRGFNAHKNKALWREGGDRIVVLSDTDLDGRADQSTVFVQDKDLVAPLGIAVFGNRILISCSPNLLLYVDVNKNGVFDPAVDRKEVFLTGFGGVDHDHGLHAVVAGPDGQWYFNAGNAGPHIVTDRAGWTLRAGSSYTGGTPYNTRNIPGLRSDDGRIYVGGLALRVRPDGTGLAVHSHNFRNNYEVCLDSLGNLFQNDNDDQVVACRTTWLMEHANAGYASADGQRTWQADQRPGQPVPIAHWHQDDPGVVPFGDLYGAGSPTGIAVYEGDALGPEYRGLLLSCEAGRNVVWGYHVRPQGAGYGLERFSLVASTADDPGYQWSKRESDPRKWFRPSDVAVGPDGAVYVADWFDPVVGGHQMDDRRARGAIYRIAPAGFKDRALPVPEFDTGTLAGAVTALRSPAPNVRFLGFESLLRHGEAALPALEELLSDANPYVRARAVWVMARLGEPGAERAGRLLAGTDATLRLVALRALKAAGRLELDQLRTAARDPDPGIRREVALALRNVPLGECRDILMDLAERFDGQDRWYLEAFGTACEGRENDVYPTLLGRLGALPADWDDRFAALIWRLHPAHAVVPLAQRAASPALDRARRKQAIDSLAFIGTKEAAVAVANLATTGPSDLRDEAAWWVHFRQNNLWRAHDVTLGPALQASVESGVELPPQPAYVSPVIRKGDIADIDVDLSGARTLYLVVLDGGDDIGCDWADWIEPRLVDAEGKTIPLTSLAWREATSGWGKVHVNRNTYGLPLRVNDHPVRFGIGTHAVSVIVYDLGTDGFTRFTARAGLDNGRADLGGTDHPPGRPSVVFQVYHDGPTPEEQTARLERRFLDASVPAAEREQAASRLAASAIGGQRLIALAQAGKVPEAFKKVIAAGIHQNPDLRVRALAGEHFPLASEGEAPLPPLTELARLTGNVERGKALFHGRAACATCHTVGQEGGALGPDLTHVGTKFDRLALLDAIVNPSAAITFGYEATRLVLKDGDEVTGFVTGAGDPVLIRDIVSNTQLAIDARDIASTRRLTTSIMPPASALALKPQDLADLAAFLAKPSMKRP